MIYQQITAGLSADGRNIIINNCCYLKIDSLIYRETESISIDENIDNSNFRLFRIIAHQILMSSSYEQNTK